MSISVQFEGMLILQCLHLFTGQPFYIAKICVQQHADESTYRVVYNYIS